MLYTSLTTRMLQTCQYEEKKALFTMCISRAFNVKKQSHTNYITKKYTNIKI